MTDDDLTDLTFDPVDPAGFCLLASTIFEVRGTTVERAAATAMHRARLGAARGRITEDVANATACALTAWVQGQPQEATT